MKLLIFNFLFLTCMFTGTGQPVLSPELTKGVHVYTLSGKKHKTLNNKLLIYVPEGFTSRPESGMPLLIYLHGAIERGDDPLKIMQAGPLTEVKEKALPMIIVAPQCLPGNRWNPVALNDMLTTLKKLLPVDASRIYLTGKSMGGIGAWEFATQFPGHFAAVVPVAGRGDTTQAHSLVNIPVWAFHGTEDPVIPPEGSQNMVDAVNRAGGHAKLTLYPGAKHNVWDQTYSNPNLYEWVLKQARKQK